MNIAKRLLFTGLLVLFALASICNAQAVNALDFAYGVGTVAPLRLIGGPYAAGVVAVTVSQGYTVSTGGITFNPLSTNVSILVGAGTSQDTVTPSAVSCSTPAVYGTCSFTANFTHAHGTGDLVQSATLGAQEAVNYQALQGGGIVTVNRAWTKTGGTNTILSALAASSQVSIRDDRGPGGYWAMQPTVLTSLAVPATQTTSTVTFAGTGTWNGSYYVCITYVDALGGEGPCSATSAALASGSLTIMTIAAPAASTGAVGWRAYAGATYAAAYLLPISSTVCTLTTLESVMPACAISSAGVFPAVNLTTTTLRPNGQSPSVAVYQTMPQGHTTFAYVPIGGIPNTFQTYFGPFPSFGSTTSGQIDVLGTVSLPSGYLNTIGRTVRVSGKILGTTLNTAVVPTVTVGLGWVGGLTAGATVPVCTLTGAAVGATATANVAFSCTLTTNATGATGTIQPDGWMVIAPATGAALETVVDSSAAAIGSLSLSTQDTLYVNFTSGSNTSADLQLLDLHVETLQ
jgi:hypothetical protein